MSGWRQYVRDRTHLVRVWCVAPGCRWAGYRAEVDLRRREEARLVTEERLLAPVCPTCNQRSVRRYRPLARVTGEHPLPGMPNAADDYLQAVDGRALRQAQAEARRRDNVAATRRPVPQ